jgi:hypothetical protein
MTLRNATLFWVSVGLWWIYKRYGRNVDRQFGRGLRKLDFSDEKSHPQKSSELPQNPNVNPNEPSQISPGTTLNSSKTLTLTVASSLEILPIEILQMVLQFFDFSDILNFDNALLNHELRSRYLSALYDLDLFNFVALQNTHIQWMIARNFLHRSLIFETLTSVGLIYISKFRNSINSISIFDTITNGSDLPQIGTCPALKSFSLPHVTEQSLIPLLELNPQLEKLEIPMSQMISTSLIESILVSCRNLHHLNISETRWFTDQNLFEIIAFHPPLQSLNFRCTSVTDKNTISNLLEAYPDIHSVICYTRRLPFESNLIVLRTITRRSLLSNVPNRLFLGLESLTLLLVDSVSTNRFDLVLQEMLTLNLVNRVGELLSHPLNEVRFKLMFLNLIFSPVGDTHWMCVCYPMYTFANNCSTNQRSLCLRGTWITNLKSISIPTS